MWDAFLQETWVEDDYAFACGQDVAHLVGAIALSLDDKKLGSCGLKCQKKRGWGLSNQYL